MALLQILYVQDQIEEVDRLKALLATESIACELIWVKGRRAFQSALQGALGFDLILADCCASDCPAPEALAMALLRFPATPVLFFGRELEEASVLRCLQEGATDCLINPSPGRLAHGVRRALKGRQQGAALLEAQATASRARSLLRAALEASSEGILVGNLANKVAVYNRRFLSLCGLPEAVMAPLRMDQVLQFLLDHFEDPEAFLKEASLLEPKADKKNTGLLLAKDGRVLEGQAWPSLSDGQAAGTLFSFRDVTERERAMDQLKQRMSIQQSLLRAACIGRAAPWCLDGDRLTFPEEPAGLLGRPAWDPPRDLTALEALIHPEDLASLRRALGQPREAVLELRLRQPDDQWLWTQWRLERLAKGSHHGVIQDITELRRSTQAALKQGRREAMSVLAEGVANALSAGLGKLRDHLALLEDSHPLSEAQRRHIQAASSAESGIEALLELLSGPPKGQALAPAPGIRVNDLVERLLPRAEAALPAGITLHFQPGPGLPAMTLHAAHLEQVLLGLVVNARDALQGAGEIRIRTGILAPGRTGDGPGVFLEVLDTGPGLAPQVLERLFEPFFTTKDHAPGLGLWAARRLVERYGGALRAASGPHPGARFRIELPGPPHP